MKSAVAVRMVKPQVEQMERSEKKCSVRGKGDSTRAKEQGTRGCCIEFRGQRQESRWEQMRGAVAWNSDNNRPG